MTDGAPRPRGRRTHPSRRAAWTVATLVAALCAIGLGWAVYAAGTSLAPAAVPASAPSPWRAWAALGAGTGLIVFAAYCGLGLLLRRQAQLAGRLDRLEAQAKAAAKATKQAAAANGTLAGRVSASEAALAQQSERLDRLSQKTGRLVAAEGIAAAQLHELIERDGQRLAVRPATEGDGPA